MDGIRRELFPGVGMVMTVRGYLGALGLLRSDEVLRVLLVAPDDSYDLIEIQSPDAWDFWVEEAEDPGTILGILACRIDLPPPTGWLEELIPEGGLVEVVEACSRPVEDLVFRAIYLGVPAVKLLGEWYAMG